MALADYTAEEQQFITLFAAVLGKAPTPDLIAEASTYLEAGVSQADLLGVLFDHPVVPYPAFRSDSNDTAAFLTTLVANLSAGTGISAAVQTQWAQALLNDWQVYGVEGGLSKAGFAALLVEVLQGAELPAGSDLAKLQASIAAKAGNAADAYEPTDVFTNWSDLETPSGSVPNPGDTIFLTAGQDDLTGGAGDDHFYAYIFDNQNTFQSGDMINGGAGNDTLYADIGNSQNFTITPHLTSVENVLLRAQTIGGDQGDNNIGGPELIESIANLINGVLSGISTGNTDALADQISAFLNDNWRGSQVDAERSVGVNHWESNNSRADLIVEDVRILDSQITKDITIAFVDSDPGNVDFAVYFDQNSLRKAGDTATTALTLTIYNPLSESDGFDENAPLTDAPYDQLFFNVGGQQVRVWLNLEGVETYEQLEVAIRAGLDAAIAEFPQLAGYNLVRLDDSKSFFSVDGELRFADEFVLSLPGGALTPAATGWGASAGLPSDNAFAAGITQGTPVVASNLITSTVILDNVGRGSTGGDLVIGGLSVGDTSASKGVEQFDITVKQSSKLQTITSTNNTLEVVTLKNDGTYTDYVDGLPVVRSGNLTALGAVDVEGFGYLLSKHVNTAAGDLPLPGAVVEEGTGFGLTDVREVDASAFLGDITLSAVLTGRIVDKYLDRLDTGSNPADDNIEFEYTMGSGNDTFALEISDASAIARGTTAWEDFELLIDGGSGDDVLMARIGDEYVDPTDADYWPATDNWYLNSKLNANLAVVGGDGNDTVHTINTGDWVVDLGAGDDTYYADNSGGIVAGGTPADPDVRKATWVLNTSATAPDATNLNNLGSDVNNSYLWAHGKLTVSFSHTNAVDGTVEEFAATVDLLGTNGKVTDLAINNAIKEAINSDPVLSKLLVAEDGPGNTLVVTSLIDGTQAATDLEISLSNLASANDLSATEVQAYNTANGTALDKAGVFAAQDGVLTAWNAAGGTAGDYLAKLANLGGTTLTGAESFHQADNIVTGGAGDDVLVLGTGQFSSDTVVYEGFNNGFDTILNFAAGAAAAHDASDVTDFTAGVGAAAGFGQAEDKINLSSYDADYIFVEDNGGAVFDDGALAATGGTYISFVESDVAGVYNVALYSSTNNTTGDADDVLVGEIATIDFGATKAFTEFDFIW